MIDDPHDRRLAVSAHGLLARFNRADVLAASDVHVADRMEALLGGPDEVVQLAVALAVRAARLGSVCVDLARVSQTPVDDDVELPWPDPQEWIAAVSASRLIEQEVLRLDGTLLYLDRFWREEQHVWRDLLGRIDGPQPVVDDELLASALDRVLPGPDFAEQRRVVEAAATRFTTVLTGGPGTGKTTTVARLLAVLVEQFEHRHGRRPRVALCAPTAKAAARLTEAVHEEIDDLEAVDAERLGRPTATTIHRLLGVLPGLVRTRFRHDRRHRLPHDVVVVDETSMVSLTMMARILEAVRPDARLVLVGDADQLASIEAGAVLGDIVTGLRDHPARPVATLTTVHRFGGAIGDLADALRGGDADRVLELLQSPDPDVELVDPADADAVEAIVGDVVTWGEAMWTAAESGDAGAAVAALDQHRLLCAHREGPHGVRSWNLRIERALADRTGVSHYAQWYPGRPVLVTANNSTLRVWNGDVGVTVRRPDGRLAVALAGAEHPDPLATTRLPDTETLFAMTVHKSQGSQAGVITIVLPPDESALLTRELFYTAVTRATGKVRLIGTPDAVRAAIERRALRASGLAARLAGDVVS